MASGGCGPANGSLMSPALGQFRRLLDSVVELETVGIAGEST